MNIIRPPVPQTILRVETRVWGRFASLADTNGSTVAAEIQAAVTRLPDGHEGLREPRPESRDVQRVAVATAAYERLLAYARLHGCSVGDALVRAYELHTARPQQTRPLAPVTRDTDAIAARRAQVAALIQERATTPQIAELLGVTASIVKNDWAALAVARRQASGEVPPRARTRDEVDRAVAEAVDRVRAGSSIAAEYRRAHVGRARLAAACRAAGIEIRAGVSPVRRARREQALTLVKKGRSDRQIADTIGWRTESVARVRRTAGLAPRGVRRAAA